MDDIRKRDYLIGALIACCIMLWFKVQNINDRLDSAHALALHNSGELMQIPRDNPFR